MVVQLEQIVRKRERQGDGILRKVRQRIFLALLPLLCVVRICGLGGLARWIGRRLSVSHAWKVHTTRRRAANPVCGKPSKGRSQRLPRRRRFEQSRRNNCLSHTGAVRAIPSWTVAGVDHGRDARRQLEGLESAGPHVALWPQR